MQAGYAYRAGSEDEEGSEAVDGIQVRGPIHRLIYKVHSGRLSGLACCDQCGRFRETGLPPSLIALVIWVCIVGCI